MTPLLLVLSTLMMSALGQVRDRTELMPYLGKFKITTHLVDGHAYATRVRGRDAIFLSRFYYDGRGPDYVEFKFVAPGENDYDKGHSLEVQELGTTRIADEILNEDLTLLLPPGVNYEDLGKLVLWCPLFGVQFGQVIPKETDQADRPKPLVKELGSFIETEHGVNGTVFLKDENTLVIHNFNYDGQGPSVFFYGGHERDLTTGVPIQYPYRRYVSILGPDKLKAHRYRDIELKLPDKLDAYKMIWLSVWCDLFEVSFGHVLF